jgi:hypothetical protein
MALRLLAVLLACAALAPGQRAVYELFGVERGLTNLSITAWAQDTRGLIWVGTERGLFRFDGSQFRRYGEEDGLPNELVMGLGVGPDGTLWVSTFGGLVFKRSARFEKPTDEQLSGPLTAQAVAFRDGKAYFATHTGVAVGDWPPGKTGLQVQFLPSPPEEREKVAKALAVGPNGDVWCCAASRVRNLKGSAQRKVSRWTTTTPCYSIGRGGFGRGRGIIYWGEPAPGDSKGRAARMSGRRWRVTRRSRPIPTAGCWLPA